MNHSSYADVELKIEWQSDQITHSERRYFQGINFWRDYFPGQIGDRLISSPDGEWVTENIHASEIFPAYSTSSIIKVNNSKLRSMDSKGFRPTLLKGRFYPRSIIAGCAGVTAEELLPLRVVSVDDDCFTVDLNHPLARNPLVISLRVVGKRYAGKEERGGRCQDIVYELLMNGPGLQSPFPGGVDFYSGEDFTRIDDQDDALLYQQPNFEDTFDRASAAELSAFYSNYLQDDDRVLDMMCGAQSYLPMNIDVDTTGIGLNEDELKANPQLENYVVQNVNTNTDLPFGNNQFDAVVFTAAVEYLIDPVTSFSELSRITRPGGHIIVTFTDHWVARKSIRLWSELYSFERMGLVIDYFNHAERLNPLHTETIQGLLRPEDDRDADRKLYADPVFAVVAEAR
jgi:SAM-dependent methyltransferase